MTIKRRSPSLADFVVNELLRSLDAIHVATAIEVRNSLEVVVTYDDRMAAAGRVHGFATAAPGSATP